MFRALIVALLVTMPSFAFADDDAEALAFNFLQHLDQGNLADTYQSDTSPKFKANMPSATFVEQVQYGRIQLGGPASSRSLMGGQPMHQLPNMAPGDYYYVRYKTQFPNTFLFQDVYLERQDGAWKVIGFWNLPVPK
jgi:hypothetical protein